MSEVSYNKVCKSCLTSKAGRAIIVVYDEIKDIHKKTEHEYSKEIKKWLKEGKVYCDYCRSPYFDIYDVEINNYRLFDYNRLVEESKKARGELFIWEIIRSNGQLGLKISGKTAIDPLFLEECFKEIIAISNTINFGEMSLHDSGYLCIAFTGKYTWDADDNGTFNPIIQRFLCRGILPHEFEACIKYQLNNFGLGSLTELLIER